MKLGILIDSSAVYDNSNLTNTNIELINLHIITSDGTDLSDSIKEIKKYDILNKIKDGFEQNIKTSQASMGELEKKYDEMLKKYDHILHIPIAKNLSSMLQTSILVSNYEKYKNKVTVYKNLDLTALSILDVANKINELFAKKKIKIQNLTKEIDSMLSNYHVFIIPGNLKSFSKGGRGMKILAKIFNLLKTKMLITWNNHPKKEMLSRTLSNLIKKIIDILNVEFNNNYILKFVYNDLANKKNINIVTEILDENNIKYEIESIPVPYLIHAGIETLGFIAIKR